MSSIPPDPGNALNLAKTCSYNTALQAFEKDGALRWLYPEGGVVWIACTTAERLISQDTYNKLRTGTQNERQRALHLFEVAGELYALVDDGFFAAAERVR